ncbi:MAG: hypothetical protein K8S99_17435 [Planctomycetes bacterium]|nr:hypothetical protein [Planctomycetota bacterium]
MTVIVGSVACVGDDAPRVLPGSDRAAAAVAKQMARGPFHAAARGGDVEAMRYALASGARSVGLLDADTHTDFDIALIGSGGCGELGDTLPATLAETRGAALVFEVLAAEITGEALRVTRDLGRGAREVLRVTPPAVLVMSGDAPRGGYVSRHRLRSINLSLMPPPLALSDEAAPTDWEHVRPRTRTTDLAARTGGPATARMQNVFGITESIAAPAESSNLITADAATCARHLLRYLAHHGFITRKMEPVTDAPEPAAQSTTNLATTPTRAASGLSLTHRLARSPRPVDQPVTGITRRPRPASTSAQLPAASHNRLRGPRPVGVASPPRLRGPFPFPNP